MMTFIALHVTTTPSYYQPPSRLPSKRRCLADQRSICQWGARPGTALIQKSLVDTSPSRPERRMVAGPEQHALANFPARPHHFAGRQAQHVVSGDQSPCLENGLYVFYRILQSKFTLGNNSSLREPQCVFEPFDSGCHILFRSKG